jgi:hypothetical protein
LGAIPRATEAVKDVAKNVARVLQKRPPGIQPDIRVPDAIKNVIGKTITKPQLPLALFVIVVLFLLVQNRIDRRDPKLAAAPVAAEPELEFGPRVRFVATGGATAGVASSAAPPQVRRRSGSRSRCPSPSGCG